MVEAVELSAGPLAELLVEPAGPLTELLVELSAAAEPTGHRHHQAAEAEAGLAERRHRPAEAEAVGCRRHTVAPGAGDG